ncbi:esterase-like activity of phytase family protein [Sphingomonas qomolangmaensis]|uniref:Esterase-like activity of phytase family protein n=1 Tax=Sphingomonas qomolangmaensis TaxID=2918765 RepID=A0ABY5L673_9SPHN|nr:esterase-like activity of phytase family protein [Sphingomonas qomolangmaensis]UUL81563.1 esterase-like activity of phytase family protein [Sphingomonas qomolangmaensis]
MRITWSVLLLLVFVHDYSGPARVQLPGNVRVTATAVDIVPGDPAQKRVGGLTYLGGVHLQETGQGRGGYSGIAVAGDRFTLMGDGGNLLSFRLRLPATLQDVRAWALPDGPGTGWQKRDRDSESLAFDRESGTAWVGFEHHNQIWRYSADLRTATGHAAPRAMRDWPEAGGAEAMARLADGSVVVLSESSRPREKRGLRHAIRFAGDPVAAPEDGYRFLYRPPAGFRPVDAVQLPDSRLLVLNRAFGLPYGFTAKLTLVDVAAIAPGATVRGREIATLAPPTLFDNFEGVTALREGDATVIWVVSDDNQQFPQRTLLLKFRLDA